MHFISRLWRVRGLAASLAACSIGTLLVAGCASVSDRAAELGQAGQKASDSLATVYGTLSGETHKYRLFLLYRTPDVFACEPDDRKCVDARSKLLDTWKAKDEQIADIRKSLAIRASLFEALGRLYGKLGELAQVRAREDFAKALGDLTNATAALAKKTGHAIPEFAGDVVSEIGGWAIELIKSEMLRAASRKIRLRLKALLPPLEADVQTNDVLYREVAYTQQEAIVRLWRNGLIRFDPALSVVLDGYPAKVVGSEAKLTYNQKAFASYAFERHTDMVRQARIDAFNAAQAQAVEAIKQLIRAHEKLEARSELQLGNVMLMIQELESIAAKAKH